MDSSGTHALSYLLDPGLIWRSNWPPVNPLDAKCWASQTERSRVP